MVKPGQKSAADYLREHRQRSASIMATARAIMSHSLDPYTYILIDRKPVQCANDDAWWMWYQNIDNRRVALTEIGDKSVSTVFVGIDNNYGLGPKPLLFETAFTDSYGIRQEWNSATWEDAERRHAEAVAKIKEVL